MGKEGAFPLSRGGGRLLTCLSSPGRLRARELCAAFFFFFLLFPVFVQIKTNQKKRVLWVNSNTWGVERNQVIPCFKGLCEWL